jgi:glycerol-3-phosphate acyltransferase PlsX
VVDGALLALDADPALSLHLVGLAEAADEVVSACAPGDRSRLSIQRVASGVRMVDAPSRAVRHDTSVRAAVVAVADGRAHALVSAGMSGAIVTAAALGLGRLPGVRKPALAAVLPAQAGPLVLLDVGASPEASASVLVQHAGLGVTYATRMLGIAAPRLGLLSIGAEPGKGDRARRTADEALRASQPGYVGFVEGGDVPLGGAADVVLTDGFTGNVLLKGIEGAFALAGGVAPHSAVPRAAVLLGVHGTVVVCHGAATATDLASGIALAARLHRREPVPIRRGTATSERTRANQQAQRHGTPNQQTPNQQASNQQAQREGVSRR